MSPWLSNGNWAENLSLSLSLLPLSSARRDDKNTNVAFFYLCALFFHASKPKSAREERWKRETRRTVFYVREITSFFLRQGSFRRKIYTFAEKKWCWDKIQEQREQKHSTHNVLRYKNDVIGTRYIFAFRI